MSNVIAIVKSMIGQAEVISAEGVRRPLIEGDRLFKGDQLVTGPSASVNLALTEGGDVAVKGNAQWSDSSPAKAEEPIQANETAGTPEALMQNTGTELTEALSADFDPTANLEATAAGAGAAGGAGGTGGGHSFVLLDETAEQLSPPVGFPTQALGFAAESQSEEFAGQDNGLSSAAQDRGVLAVDDGYTLNEDGSISLDLLANDLASDGGLKIQSINGTTLTGAAQSITVGNGVIAIAADGSMTFTPDANFNGTIEFSYVAQDADGDTASATITFTVNPVDDATVVANDSVTVDEDNAVIIDVLANDSDIDSPKSPVASITQGANGSVSINPDGTLTYTPKANFNGSDSFTYTNTEGATATVSVTINPVNDAPVAVADSYTTDEDTPLMVDAANGVLANDSDVDNSASSLSAILVTGPANGTLTLNSDGSFTFTPDANWSGSDSFTYKTTDGLSDSAPITVSLGVNPVNDAPVNSTPATLSVTEDVASPITGISVSDVDAGSSSLSVTLSVPAGTLNATSAAGVNVSGNGTGALVLSGSAADINAFIAASQVSYNTALNANGAVTLTVTTDDGGNTGSGGAKSDSDTVTLNITPVNDAPVAVADSYTTDEDTPLVVDAANGVLANDTDIDSSASSLTAILVSGPANGTLTFNSNGSFTFTPDANWSGSDSFTYKTTDGLSDSAPITVSLGVNPVNDAPTTNPVTLAAIAEDSGARLITQAELLANASDIDGPGLTATGLTIATGNGNLVDNGNGTWTYTPAPNDDTGVTFSYTVTDGSASVAGSATLDITPVNDLSVITPASTTLTETNSVQSTSGVLSISDIDGPAPSFVAQSNALGSGGFGRFTLTSSGNWTYTTSGAQNNLVAGQTYTDTLTVQGADGSTGTLTVTLTGTNDAPVLSGITSSRTYTESPSSTVTRTRLDTSVTLTDVDSANFDGGQVTVSLLNGVASQDQLTVFNQGTNNGQISVSGSDVRYNFGSGPVSIGTLSGGTGGVPLSIALNGNATAKSVEVLIENVAYGNTSALPDTTTRQIRITVNDGDGTALGGTDSVSHTLNLTVISSNDAPSLGALGGTRSHTEGGSAVVLDNNATLTDPELVALNNFGGSVLTLSRRGGADANDDFRGSGSLTLSGGEVRLGGTLVGSYDPATLDAGTLRITFADGVTQAQATSVLRGIAYANTSDAPPASVRIDYVLNDGNTGAQGTGGARNSATGSVVVNISAVNDAPVNTVPTTISVTEDVASPLSGISISDADAGSASLSVTLSVPAGSLSATSSASVTVAGSGTGSLILSGSAADINAFIAANQVNYTTAPNANGSVTLTITTNDLGNTGSGGAKSDTDTVTLNITAVNDAPVNTAPASIAVTEDVASPITGISVSDVDAGSSSLSVTLSVPAGSLSATSGAGVTEAGSGTGSLVLSGSAANINAFIAANQVNYTTAPNANGSVTLTITTNDLGNTGSGGAQSDTDTVTLNITAVNDAPAGTDATLSTAEDTSYTLTIADFGFSDANDSPADLFSSVLLNLPSAGTLALDGNVLTASTEVSAADILAGKLTFTPAVNASGSPYSSLTFQVRDNGGSANGGSDTDSSPNTLTFNVNAVADTPNLSLQGTQIAAATDFQSAPLGGASWSANINASSLNTGLGSNWNTDNPGGLLEIGTQNTYMGGGSTNQVIELERVAGDAANLFTEITAKAGNTYSLDFDYSPRSGQTSNSGIQVFWGGNLIDTMNAASVGFQTFHFDLTAPADGTYRLEFKATDSNSVGGLLDNISLKNVLNVGNEDTYIPLSKIQAQLIDTDGSETLALSIGNIPVGATLTDNAGKSFTATPGAISTSVTGWNLATLSILPPANFNGSFNLEIKATATEGSNSASASTTQNLTVTVNPVNDAPTIVVTQVNNFTEDAATNAIGSIVATYTTADADNNPVTVTLSDTINYALNGSGGVTLTAAGLALVNSGQELPAFTLTPNDGSVNGTAASVDPTVTPANDAPTVANAIADQSATEDAPFNFQFSRDAFNDVDVGDTLTYSAQLAGGGALPGWLNFDARTRTFSGTPANGDVGSVAIDVIADDGNGSTVTDTFNLVVANTNDAPTVNKAIADQNATEDAPFNFQFASTAFSDIDVGDTLTYSAQLAGGGALPSWLSFDPLTRTFSGTPANGDVGSVAIDVIADDGNGGTVTDTFNLVVANTNDAPTVSNAIADQTATEDAPFNFQFSRDAFNDIDVGDTLTFSAQLAGGGALPGWLNFDALTRTFSGTPADGDVGSIAIDVIAVDGNGRTVTDTFNLVVANTNDAPVASSDSYIVSEDATLVVSANAGVLANDNDVDTAKADLTAQLVSGTSHGALTLNSDGSFSYTPAANWSGTDSFTYRTFDGTDYSAPVTVNLGVTPVADAPNVSVTLGTATPTSTIINTSNVTSTNQGFTVTALEINGSAGTISINGSPAGFGVSGAASGANNELGQNGTRSEQINVVFTQAVTTAAVSFAWMNANERAAYKLFDSNGLEVGSGTLGGGSDGIDPAINFSATNGVAFSRMEFSAPLGGDHDYLIHSISFVSATRYPVTITATPADLDGSESITGIDVYAPAGATLSAGTLNADGTWTLPLTTAAPYTVTVDPVTKAVTISGLEMTVPSNITGTPALLVAATVVDGSDTVRAVTGTSGADSIVGTAGADLLRGGDGNDILIADDEEDILIGGNGDDTLTGGNGEDTFIWKAGDLSAGLGDRLTDFDIAEDRIDLRDLLQNETDATIGNFLRVDITTSTLQISSNGQFGNGGSADVTIKLENAGAPVDLSSYGSTSSQIVNSLIAGADPLVKVEHN